MKEIQKLESLTFTRFPNGNLFLRFWLGVSDFGCLGKPGKPVILHPVQRNKLKFHVTDSGNKFAYFSLKFVAALFPHFA